MKGRIATSTTIKLVIAVIVIGVALWFLTQIFNLDFLFPNDQRTLKQYSTCALAYCAAGAGSDEVRAVGCLKYKGGQCELSCLQVEEKIFEKGKESFSDFAGRAHYCGKENVIPFEFEGVTFGGAVNIRSGQMDKLATSPSWVCKSFEIFGNEVDRAVGTVFPNLPGLSSADWAYHGNIFGVANFPQNCIMLSKSVPDYATYGQTMIFIGSFFVGGPQTAVGIKAGTTAAFATLAKGSVTRAASGVLVSSTPKQIAKTLVNLPGKGSVQKWTVQGAERGAGAVVGSSIITASDPFNFFNLQTNGGCFTGYVYDDLSDDRPSNKDLLYTPLIQYKKTDQEKGIEGNEHVKVYPSAIYVDESFTDPSLFGEAECEFINPARAQARNAGRTVDFEQFKQSYYNENRGKYEGDIVETVDERGNVISQTTIDSDEERQILEQEALQEFVGEFGEDDPIVGLDMYGPINQPFDYGNMLRECSFRTHRGGEKITYRVWASPTFPGIGTLNALSRGGYDVAEVEVVEGLTISKDDVVGFTSDNPNLDNFNVIGFIGDSIDNALTSLKKSSTAAFSNFGSCAYVTLDRDLETDSIGVKAEEPTTGDQVSAPMTISIELDKPEYGANENVVISGKIENFPASSAGDRVKIDLTNTRIDFTLTIRATIESDGTFVNNEFMINEGLASGTVFKVVAEYKDVESEVKEFKIK